MGKDLKKLESLFDSKLYDVTDGHNKEMEKANQKYVDAICEIVEQALSSASKFKCKEDISFKNKAMGDFINTENEEDIDHIGCSYSIINNSGITIHLHYNYWTNKHKPSFNDEDFDLKTINKLLSKYNIEVTETSGEYGSDDTYVITYHRKMEKSKTKTMTKTKEKGN